MKITPLAMKTLPVLFILAVPVTALAQTPSAPVTLTAFTPTQITISVLAFLVALAVNAYNSGKVFNLVTVPQPWLPYLGVGIPFLSAVYASLSSAAVITGAAVWNAIMAGLFALLASAMGAGVHTTLQKHFAQAHITKAAQAALKVVPMAILVLSLSSCAGKVPPSVVPPSTDCIENVIVDALSGMGVPEIVAKEGPGCAVDAAQVIAILLDPSNEKRVAATKAYAQAQATHAAQEQERKSQ